MGGTGPQPDDTASGGKKDATASGGKESEGNETGGRESAAGGSEASGGTESGGVVGSGGEPLATGGAMSMGGAEPKPEPDACVTGQLLCDEACIDPLSDTTHCGATDDCQGQNAGESCGGEAVCLAGKCQQPCAEGLVSCGAECIDPLTDAAHCGAGEDCLGQDAGDSCEADEVCQAGVCELVCKEDWLDCFGECIDPSNNDLYCGARNSCLTIRDQGDYCETDESCVNGRCLAWDETYINTLMAAPFATATRVDGMVAWVGNRSGNGYGFRTIRPDAVWSNYVNLSSGSYHDFAAVFAAEGALALTYFSRDVAALGMGTFNPLTGESLEGYDTQRWTYYVNVAADSAGGLSYLFSPHPMYGSNAEHYVMSPPMEGQDSFSSRYVSGGAVAEKNSIERAPDFAAIGWKSDYDTANFRFMLDDTTCCAEQQLSGAAVGLVDGPVVQVDAGRNTHVVWSEWDGSRWAVYLNRYIAGAEPPSDWQVDERIPVAENAVTDARFPAFDMSDGGDGLLVWWSGDESHSPDTIGYRSYNGLTGVLGERRDLSLPSGNTAGLGSTELQLSINEQGTAILAWVQEDVLYATLYKEATGKFAQRQALALATPGDSESGIENVRVEIDFQGRAYVFWHDLATGLIAVRHLE